jgi:DNA-binding SARP family transcriptional activator
MSVLTATYDKAYEKTQPHSPSVPVFICLLGPFRLFKQGDLLFNNSQKAELLLSTLALQPKRVATRAFLLDTLWPDTDPGVSGPLLRGLLCKLRQAFNGVLGGQPLVMREDDRFRLNLSAGVGIDVTEFETAVLRGDQAQRTRDDVKTERHYAHALELYRGDLLAHSFMEAEIERERLRGLYLRALSYLTQDRFRKGDYVTCLNYAYQMLISNPLHEEAHRTAMRCYVRRNERGEALRQFQLCRNMLRTELNIMPERETLTLYQQICSDA